MHERLLAVIRDFIVDGKTFTAFIRAHEEAMRIVREGSSDFSLAVARRSRLRCGNRSADKIPCGCLAVTSSPAALDTRPSQHALTRYFTPLPSAVAKASVTAEPLPPMGELKLTEDPFCDD